MVFWSYFCQAQVQNGQFTVTPQAFSVDEEITISVSGIDANKWGVSEVYFWAWYFHTDGQQAGDSPSNGTWNNSDERQKCKKNADGTYSVTFVPKALFQTEDISKFGILLKAKNGSGDKKTQDHLFEVGKFQLSILKPKNDPIVIDPGVSIDIEAECSLKANMALLYKDDIIASTEEMTRFTHQFVPQKTGKYEIRAIQNQDTIRKYFTIIIKPQVVEKEMPSHLLDGLNIDSKEELTLVLFAPGKSFVHLIFPQNDWALDDQYLLFHDPKKDRFWITIPNYASTENFLYQYVVDGHLRIADPYSTLVLSEYNDAFIDDKTFAQIPAYPSGKTNHAVSFVYRQDDKYAWRKYAYTRPAKKDLVIYELLLRDFDNKHSFQAIEDRLDYLQSLGVNAIELLPINEFDGNLSWGYNPAFHMALDKYYGPPNGLKKLVDECHSRGMAVIVDIVFNHATGQNPYYRMWNTDNGNYGGQATAESAFFNSSATHSYSVFNDFNHQKKATQDYVKRCVQYWIREYQIDGFRWDLTKGFTQNCAGGESCTNAYQKDRVEVLKKYADFQWEVDPSSYVIFEHLGGNKEETEWVNYRRDEGKGIMLWGNENRTYGEASLGYNESKKSDFSWISYKKRGWTVPANITYMESHDEERLMYKNQKYGNANGDYNIKELETALKRQEMLGAFYFTIPGPKMIWQFGELGYDYSIDFNGRTGEKPIRWDYLTDPNRNNLREKWAEIINLRQTNAVFHTTNFTLDVDDADGLKQISLTSDEDFEDLHQVHIIGNFSVKPQSFNVTFPQTGKWYDLLDADKTLQVSSETQAVYLEPGEFHIYGDALVTNNTASVTQQELSLFPNPAGEVIRSSWALDEVKVMNIYGQVLRQKKNIGIGEGIQVATLAKGYYYVTGRKGDQYFRGSFIKQ